MFHLQELGWNVSFTITGMKYFIHNNWYGMLHKQELG